MEVLTATKACLGFLAQGRLPPGPLLSALVSKVLGYAIILGAAGLKVPQILSVLRAGSAEGLAPISVELEMIGFTIHSGYGYTMGLPFSAYGEAMLVWIQNAVLLAIVYAYNRTPWTRRTLVAGAVSAMAYTAATGALSRGQVTSAYEANTFIFAAARLPQILSNYRSGSTGALSFLTCALNLAGGVARIFTSMQEGAGWAMVRGFLIGTVLNAALVVQCLYYGSKKKLPAAKKDS